MSFMFNKPQGCITARRDRRHKTVMDYFPAEYRNELFPVGRLDKDTTGFLIITNDGMMNHLLMHPDNHVDKTYYFWIYGDIDDNKLSMLINGVDIGRGEEYITKPCKVELIYSGSYDEYADKMRKDNCIEVRHNALHQQVSYGCISISEGKKHQIKRMFRAVGCYVVMLKRTAIGEIQLDNALEPGEYRALTQKELSYFINRK